MSLNEFLFNTTSLVTSALLLIPIPLIIGLSVKRPIRLSVCVIVACGVFLFIGELPRMYKLVNNDSVGIIGAIVFFILLYFGSHRKSNKEKPPRKHPPVYFGISGMLITLIIWLFIMIIFPIKAFMNASYFGSFRLITGIGTITFSLLTLVLLFQSSSLFKISLIVALISLFITFVERSTFETVLIAYAVITWPTYTFLSQRIKDKCLFGKRYRILMKKQIYKSFFYSKSIKSFYKFSVLSEIMNERGIDIFDYITYYQKYFPDITKESYNNFIQKQ